jgi:hypothetical protein
VEIRKMPLEMLLISLAGNMAMQERRIVFWYSGGLSEITLVAKNQDCRDLIGD